MLKVLNGPIIAAGESLSDGLDCSEGRSSKSPCRATGSATRSRSKRRATASFYNDIFKPDGTELKFRVIAGTGIIGMRLNTGFVKFRSGTRERPVVQPELREFAVALDVVADAARRRAANCGCGYSWRVCA